MESTVFKLLQRVGSSIIKGFEFDSSCWGEWGGAGRLDYVWEACLITAREYYNTVNVPEGVRLAHEMLLSIRCGLKLCQCVSNRSPRLCHLRWSAIVILGDCFFKCISENACKISQQVNAGDLLSEEFWGLFENTFLRWILHA